MEGDEEESGCLARHVSTYKHRAVHLVASSQAAGSTAVWKTLSGWQARDYVQDHIPAELGKAPMNGRF